MFRKSLAALVFTMACSITLYADAAEQAPAPRPVEDKKPDAPAGKLGGRFGKLDPEKLKELKEKLKNVDPEKLKELKDKFGGKVDLEKLKERLKKAKGDE